VEGFLLVRTDFLLSGKGKGKEMELLNSDLKEKYAIKQDTLADGTIRLILTPKHIDCFGCSKEIEYDGANLLVWVDQDHYKREARFCRTCSSELNTMGYFNK
tara:strand:- start:294 stop:599 length:306 start_codon:yes stop_codon:yes gene_type:complete